MPTTVIAQPLENLLAASAATTEFKEAVRALQAGKSQNLIKANASSPAVKVLRFISKLLEVRPDLALESLELAGNSGCSDFSGRAKAMPGPLNVEFVWDCKWRAEEMGWNDHFGDPDQIRAARELGYQCFQKFEVREG